MEGPPFPVRVPRRLVEVYVGAHYPLDVLVGGVLGVTCGFIVWKGFELIERGRHGKSG